MLYFPVAGVSASSVKKKSQGTCAGESKGGREFQPTTISGVGRGERSCAYACGKSSHQSSCRLHHRVALPLPSAAPLCLHVFFPAMIHSLCRCRAEKRWRATARRSLNGVCLAPGSLIFSLMGPALLSLEERPKWKRTHSRNVGRA